MNERDQLVDRFPWLTTSISQTEYLVPEYYERILKPYIFNGKTDLELFVAWLRSVAPSLERCSAFEIGPGPGRATAVFLTAAPSAQLRLVDLSQRMLRYCRERFCEDRRLTFENCDALDFSRDCAVGHDIGFAMWSFSHSIHRCLQQKGEVKGTEIACLSLQSLFERVLKPGGRFFLMHFDPESPEQRISLRQRSKLQRFFLAGSPVPSQRILKRVLDELAARGVLRFTIEHLTGDAIRYSSMDEALETFLNLHMEGMFNNHPLLPEVVCELEADFSTCLDLTGQIAVGTGCYIYLVESVSRPECR